MKHLYTVLCLCILFGSSWNAFAFDEGDLKNLKATKQCRKCDLAEAKLTDADLTNADLFLANLTVADLRGANLSGANLSGANLSDVFIDENTNLNCKNHPICLND